MRDWTGVDYSSLPPPQAPDFTPRVRRMLGDIDYFLRDLSRGMGRIQQGQVPDGSGSQIGNNGTLTNYWFKPGISDPFIAFMSTASQGGGNISSTSHDTKGFIKLGYPTPTVYVDEASAFAGINVAAPAAALHLQSGVSGTTTLIPTTSVVHNWDSRNRTGVGGTDAGAFTIASLKTSDDYTLYNGVGTLGTNPETVGMGDGTSVQNITPNKVWTCTFRVACLGTTVDNSGDAEFHIVDSTGTKYSATGMTGLLNGLGTTFTDYTFTINGAGTSTGSGTANTVIIGLSGKNGLNAQYIACTYFQITTGGSSDIMRWNNDGGTGLLGKITKDGYVGIGTNGDTLGGMLSVECDSATQIGARIFGATSQSGDLQQWRSQSALLSRIKSDGTFEGPITANPLTTTDANFTVTGSADPTKTLKFELDGATAGADLVVDYRSAADRSLIWSLAGAAGNDLTLSATLTGDRVITIPDVTGTLPTIQNANTITGPWTFDVDNDASRDLIILSQPGGHSGPGTGGFYLKDSTSGFTAEIFPIAAGFTADRIVSWPDSSGEVIIGTATQSVNNKTLQTSCILQSTTSGVGVRFQDTGTSTKRLRFVLSGAVGDNAIALSNTAARTYTFPDTALTVVGLVATANLTAQSAAKTATTLYAVPSNGQGLYEVQYVATVTTAATTSSVLGGANGFQLIFTDPNDSVVKTSNHTTVITSAGNTTATTVSGAFCAYCKASTNLQYAFDYTSVGGTAMQYDLRVTATFIG